MTGAAASPAIAIVGRGRAGGALSSALASVGCAVIDFGHDDPAVPALTQGNDLVLLCVPDRHIAEMARRLEAGPAVVAHVAGSQPLTVLDPHERRASLHPLMSLPDPETGATRLTDHCTFAVAASDEAAQMLLCDVVDRLGGRALSVPDDQRVRYHAAATVAANHLVALCSQVTELAAAAGLPSDTYDQLMTTTLANVVDSGPTAALTGPAARGDWATVERHLAAIPAEERALYVALSRRAASLAGRVWPSRLEGPPTTTGRR